MGLSSSGTDDEAATANDSGTESRSEQISANCSGVNSKGAPVVRSVAVTSSCGQLRRRRTSPYVVPRKTVCSRCSSTLLRPYQGELRLYKVEGDRTWCTRPV